MAFIPENNDSRIVRPESIGDQVYAELRRRLRTGAFEPNERLTETGLATSLGVSRTPVREAIAGLTRIGLLMPHPRGGVTVPKIARADIDEIFEIRFVLEPYAAELAAERHTEAQLVELRRALERESQSVSSRKVEDFIEANTQFREVTLRMAGNDRLTLCTELYRDHVHMVRGVTLEDPEVRKVALDGHARLYSAIERPDRIAARNAMIVQLENARERLLRALD